MSVFRLIRDGVDLATVADKFSDLRQSGSTLKGRCPRPSHDDGDPSFHVYGDHFHCFGCGWHGDVLDLWAGMQGVGLAEAVQGLAREYSIALPMESDEVRCWEEERRDNEARLAKQAQYHHDLLVNHSRIARYWEQRGFGHDLQTRYLLGASQDGREAILPFWHRGSVQALIRRRLEGSPKYLVPRAEDFPDGARPLFIPAPLRQGTFLVEGWVDALAVAAVGGSVVAIGGTSLSDFQASQLESFPGPFYILPDADEPGRVAGRELADRLYPKAYLCPDEYGEGCKDVADLFARMVGTLKEALEDLRARSRDALDLALRDAPEGSHRERYAYATERILPLVARLPDAGLQAATLKDVCQALGLKGADLRKALRACLTEATETQSETPTPLSMAPQPGTERNIRAMDLLCSHDLLERAAIDLERLGHVGELKNKKLALLCAVSARAGTPIQPSTHAQSGSGKNALWDSVLSLLPPEMVVRRSGLSAKALFRTDVSLKGAVLYIQEVAGSEAAEYTLRVLQSDGRLEYEATEKATDGSLQNKVYVTEGPTVIVQTTTRNHLHPENETRVFPIYLDESEEQTARIVRSILSRAAGTGIDRAEEQRVLEVWRDAVRLLEPAEVVIPYADRIQIPTSPVRIRRDALRLLDVIRVTAWLCQHGRERDASGRILASERDFETALDLVSGSLSHAWQTLTPAEKKVLTAIRQLPQEKRDQGFRRRDLAMGRELSDRRVKDVLKSLADTGYLDSDGRSGPQGFTYTVVRDVEEIDLGIRLARSPDSEKVHADVEIYRADAASPGAARYPDGTLVIADGKAAGDNRQNMDRPMEPARILGETAIGRSGGPGEEQMTVHDLNAQYLQARRVGDLVRAAEVKRQYQQLSQGWS